jgi:hypothetical protein
VALYHFSHAPNLLYVELVFFGFWFFLVGLGFEVRALHLQSKALHHLSHISSPFFALVVLKMGSCELFAELALTHDPLDLSFPSS